MSREIDNSDIMEKGNVAETSGDVDECPEGYPRLAAFLDADENFMLYRRFGFLQARILLYKQDELRYLESELDRFDTIDSKSNEKVLKSRECDDASNLRRKKLLAEIELKFKEYADLLIVAREMAGFNRPPKRDYLSVRYYFDKAAPLVTVESFIYKREDIVALKPGRESAWLDSFVEGILQKCACGFTHYIFCSPDLRKKTNPKKTGIILYSRERIGVVVYLIILLSILALLIVPVYILWYLSGQPQTSTSIGLVITIFAVFTLFFSLTLSKFTSAKRQEILAAAAAYCAVLVVFVGNIHSLPSNSGSASGNSSAL